MHNIVKHFSSNGNTVARGVSSLLMKRIGMFVIWIVLIQNTLFSQVYNNGDYRTRNGGNWNGGNCWNIRIGGGWNNTTNYPGIDNSLPNVYIQDDVTLNLTPAYHINNLTFNSNNTVTISGGQTLYVDGNISGTGTISVGGTLVVKGSISGANINGNGTILISGSFNPASFTCGTGTVNFNNAGPQTISDFNYYNLIFSGSGVKTTAAGSISVAGNWDISGSSAALNTNNTSLVITGDITGNGAITSGNGTISLAGDFLNTGTFTCGTGTVNYNGTNQQVKGTTYYNLTLANGGTKTLSASVNVNNVLNLSSGVLNTAGNIVNITNSSPSSISASSGTYIDGSLTRAMVNAGGTYLYPVGASACGSHWLTISNVSGTNPSMKVTFACTGATTADNVTVSQPPLGINWHVEKVSGTFTDATVELDGSEIQFSHSMARAAAQSGIYSKVLSTPSTGSVTANSIGSIATDTWLGVGTNLIKTFYSYQNGSWNTPTTWTSDPSGTTQVGSTIPGDGDVVEILPGRTVSLPSNVTSSGLDITIDAGAFLDLSAYRFTTGLKSLAGQGTLIISSSPAVFPTPITSNSFVNPGGGTTEYRTNSNLPAQNIYNNLTINSGSSTVTQTIPLLTINGNLNIKTGTFQINDNTAQRLQLYINGNTTVDAGAFFKVGTGVTNSTTNPGSVASGGTPPFINYFDQQSHRIVIKGDFTNRGTVRFTNLVYPLYNALPPTSGANAGFATVYFQGTSNNTLLCAGQTDFYNLVIDKGIDKTYKLTIYTSVNYSNFRLFGANTADFDITNASNANPNIKKALWIRTGTLELQGTTVIPSLSEGSNGSSSYYYIPSNGALELNGVDVIVQTTADDYREVNASYGTSAVSNAAMGITSGGTGSALGLLGNLIVNNGFLTTKESEGIITNNVASGQFILNKGTVDTKQFLSLTGAASSFEQNGGSLILRGRFQRTPSAYTNASNLSSAPLNMVRANDASLTSASGTFSMNNTSNVFTMGGGTIQIYDVCGTTAPTYALQVNSSSDNMNVTGGSIEFIPTAGSGGTADAGTHLISTSTPLANITINRASGTTSVQLSNPLTILNSFTLSSGVFSANNQDITIGGNVMIANGTTYLSGSNTTILNGSGTQTFTINLPSPLTLNNFTISKPAGIALNMAGSQSILNVTGDFNLNGATFNDNGDIINVTGNVFNSGVHTGTGKISLTGTVPQTIDGNGLFQNLELNNTTAGNPSPVSLIANTTVNGTLNLLSNKIFYIGGNNLTIGSSGAVIASGSGFSNTCFIQTSGNSGDGGLTKAYSSIASFTFPVGAVSSSHTTTPYYTPATIGFGAAPATYGSVTVIPVGYEHPASTRNGQSLTYFWRIKSSGFTGVSSVTHVFQYNTNDDNNGTLANYAPALYNRNNYTWVIGTNANPPINTGTFTFTDWTSPGNSTSFLDADYTAGDNTTGGGAFGAIRKFYSRQSGLWSSTNTWSFTSNTGTANTGGLVPGANDIVIIGGKDSVYLATNTTTANTDIRSCASLQIEKGSALDIGFNPGCNFGMVLSHPNGNGNFRLTTNYNSGSTYVFPTGDFSDFNQNLGTTELYTTNANSGTTYWLPQGVTSYGNLILSPRGGSNVIFGNNNLTIYGDLITRGQNADSWFCPTWNTNYPTAPTAVVAKTITINGNLLIQGGSLIWYGNGNIAQNFIIYGDVVVSTWGSIHNWQNTNTNQSMSIGGSLINNTNNTTGNGATQTKSCVDFSTNSAIPVIFFGSDNASITNTSGTPATLFSKVTVNKGSSQATTLNCNIGGILTTPADNWLTLQNGTFQYTRTSPAAGANFTISTATPFSIPSTAGLYINMPANANNINILIANNASNTNDLFLAGKLTVVNGNVYVGQTNGTTNNNNDIEYASGVSPTIQVDGGTLVVNGQIRRNPSISTGDLTYIQTGGAVTINGNAANTTNAKLEILNSGGFDMSGGTLTIVKGGGGSIYGDLYLRPSSSSVTGGTITFTNVTPNTVQNYLIDASIPINNLTVTGSNTGGINATVKLMVNPLVLNGDLMLSNTQSIFDANALNNINVTIKGNFTNNGSYNYYNNKTTFSGNSQSLLGSSITNFWDLIVDPITSLTVNNNNTNTVNNNLTLSNATLILGSNTLNVKGNVVNNANYTDNNTGIVLNGSVKQLISGTGTFGQLNLNNPLGASCESEITFNGNLILTNGILDINKYMLTLGLNSIITASGAGFSSSKMITSDGVWSNVGINKIFGTSPITFTYPLGVPGKYTPTILTITANSKTGSIRVNNINSHHPAVLDPNNVLGYYWEVQSSGIEGFSGNILFKYLASDVVGGPECNYISAELLTPGTNWSKSSGVNCSNHTLAFNFTGANILTGEYTAGNDPAIPNTVPQYTNIASGNWTDQSIWIPSGGTTYPCPVGGPNGFIVTIISGTTVTTSANYCTAYKTYINGTLQCKTPTFGHSLGTVYGNGTLFLDSPVFPAGRFNSFLDCSGTATLEYGGSGAYNVNADLYNIVPNLTFSGTGTRIFPDKDLTVCHQLLINGPTLDNSINNRHLFIQGTMILSAGAFKSGTGTNATVTFSGSAQQTLGNFNGSNSFNNLEIKNSSGLTLTGPVDVSNNLLLTNGLITTSNTNKLTITNFSTACVFPTGGSVNSYVDGPLSKELNRGDPIFIFPVGKKGYGLGNKLSIRATEASNMVWTVEYFHPNPYPGFTAPLTGINTMEYWRVNSAVSGSSAYINIAWDPLSDLTPLMTQFGVSDMRIARYDGINWVQIVSSVNPGSDNYNGSIETSASTSLPFTSADSTYYTLACINIVKPKVRLAPSGPICGTAGIPVTLTGSLAIVPPFTVKYTENGIPKTISPGSFPATIPTNASGGTYQLTGFTYNFPSGSVQSGVYDVNAVTAYAIPTNANAGVDQSLCGATSATLAGNSPVGSETGLWTITSGTGGTVVNPTTPISDFNGTNGSTYTLLWTITNVACSSSDEVTITFPLLAQQPASFIASSSSVCQDQAGVIYTVPNDPSVTYTWNYSGSGISIAGSGNSVTLDYGVSATSGTLSVTAKNGCGTSSARTLPIIVNVRPVPTFTVQPGTSTCVNNIVTYTTQSGQSNYLWIVPGVLGTDYTISSGGLGITNNNVSLQWLTTGSKTVQINYTNSSGCSAKNSVSSTATTVNPLPTTGPLYRQPNN